MFMKTKDRKRINHRCPSLSKEENAGLPSSDEEGRGWWGFAALAHFASWRETGS